MDIEKLKKQITPILEEYGVRRASLFGSSARGQDTEGSDIDILVEFKEQKSLFDMAGLKRDLEEKLGKKVDVLTHKAVHPYIKENVERDALEIYGEKR